MIRIEYLEVQYGRKPPVLSIDTLSINAGERVAVIGPSGAGKSTLLRAIKGYARPAHGKVEVMGVNLIAARRRDRRRINRRIGLVYQQFHLVRRLTVLQNVLCGRLGATSRWRSLLGWFSAEDRRVAWSAICEVGLREQVHRRSDRLSGGEQQRVAVARALAQQPAVLSLHQPDLACRFADRIIGLRKGRVVFDDDPAKVTEADLKELYRGDASLPLHGAAGDARASQTRTA